MSTSEPPTNTYLPLPVGQFKRFVSIFHVIFIGGLVCTLILRWRRTGLAWGWEDNILVLLVLAQASLYCCFLVFGGDRIFFRNWFWYFGAAFVLWFLEWRIEPGFEWAIGALLGQLFGVLPPRASLPGAGVVFTAYFLLKFGWSKLAAFTLWEWTMGLAMVTAWTALGLFIHKLVVTSTERARLIQELEAARTQLELARRKDNELAALQERERLARDLHDSLGHSLVTLSVQLEAAQRLYKVDPPRADELLEEMKRLTRNSMEQLRRSLAGLRTPGLGDRTLDSALYEFCKELKNRTGWNLSCAISDQARSLPPLIAEVLWRAAHEGLANAEKHSRAQNVQVIVEFDRPSQRVQEENGLTPPTQVRVRVVDDGIGLPAKTEATPGHYGLRGLRERVQGLGGTFELSAGVPKGTCLEARIPVVAA